MAWLSTLLQTLFPSSQKDLQEEEKELEKTIDTDRKILDTAPVISADTSTSVTTEEQHTLSPLASRILERAKESVAKKEGDTEKLTSPADLFLQSDAAKKKVEEIKSKVLEKQHQQEEKFTQASKQMPTVQFTPFVKKAEEKSE